jgi:hypothetical protein
VPNYNSRFKTKKLGGWYARYFSGTPAARALGRKANRAAARRRRRRGA